MNSITTVYKGDMLFETTIGQHTLEIDVPEHMGGKDRGIMPPQLFIASLGSCVAAFVAHYCEDHDMDASGLHVDVDFEKTSHPVKLSGITVKIELPNTELSEEKQKDAIKRVAEHCPVHETIESMDDIVFVIL